MDLASYKKLQARMGRMEAIVQQYERLQKYERNITTAANKELQATVLLDREEMEFVVPKAKVLQLIVSVKNNLKKSLDDFSV